MEFTCIQQNVYIQAFSLSETSIMNQAETDVLKELITVTRHTGIPVFFLHHGVGNTMKPKPIKIL